MAKPQLPMHGRTHRPGGSDPIPTVEAAGGALDTFAAWGSSFTLDDSPIVYDAFTHFASSSGDTFDLDSGLIRILLPGFYVIVLFVTCEIAGVPTGDESFKFSVKFGGDIGYSLEPPAGYSGYTPMTNLPFPAGTSDDYEVSGQRMQPISVTSSTTFPLQIEPTFVPSNDDGSMVLNWIALWGYRLSGPLSGTVSD